MFIRKCDLCEKEVERPIRVELENHGPRVDLCNDCGVPILKFLQKHKIIDKNNKEIKKS